MFLSLWDKVRSLFGTAKPAQPGSSPIPEPKKPTLEQDGPRATPAEENSTAPELLTPPKSRETGSKEAPPSSAALVQRGLGIEDAEATKAAAPKVNELTVSDGTGSANDHLPASNSHLDQSVRDALQQSNCSVRLRNRLISHELFEQHTLGDALADIEAFCSRATEVEGLGAKSLEELAALLEAVGQNAELSLEAEANDDIAIAVAPWEDDATDSPIEGRLESTCLEAFEYFGCSAKLARAAAELELEKLAIRDYLADPEKLNQRLRAVRSVGRVTIAEARDLIERYAILYDTNAGGVQDRAHNGASDTPKTRTWNGRSSRDQCLRVIDGLPERQRFVLIERFGLDGRPRQSLEAVGASVHVTRERIRQIESKAIAALQVPANREPFDRLLCDEHDDAWIKIAGGNDLATDQEIRENLWSLDPLFRLAIRVVHEKPEQWLEANARRIDTGWLSDAVDPDELDEAVERINAILDERPTPTPIAAALSTADIRADLLDVALEHMSNVAVLEGYLCRGHVGARLRRCVRLHRVATCCFPNQPFEISGLVEAYQKEFPDDQVSLRVHLAEIERATHLFHRAFDDVWFALPVDDRIRKLECWQPPTASSRWSTEPGSDTIASRIFSALSNGPRRLVDLRDDVAAFGRQEVASSSVGTVLAQNPEFRRIAPGTFYLAGCGIYETPSVLLGSRPCRNFCFARYGGAPLGWYPAWSARYEAELLEWARSEAEPELYRSLLFVSEPGGWPSDVANREDWIAAKSREAAWLIGYVAPTELGGRFLEPAQFVSVLGHLTFLGSTSWVAVNRSTENRGEVHDAADILAFLAVTGIVDAPDDWQAPHIATPLAKELFKKLCLELFETGRLSWDEGGASEVWSMIDEENPAGRLGWVPQEDAISAAEAWRIGGGRRARAFDRVLESPDADEIFGSDEWESLFR